MEHAAQFGGKVGVVIEESVLDHYHVADGIDAGFAVPVCVGLVRVREQRLDCRHNAGPNPDSGVNLAGLQHFGQVVVGRRHHVGRRDEFGHVLVAGQHPGHRVQVNAVLGCQDAASPHAGGQRVAADAYFAAFQVARLFDTGTFAYRDATVVKSAGEEHRNAGEGFAVGAGAQVGGQRHLRHVELQATHHATEDAGDGRHLGVRHCKHR